MAYCNQCGTQIGDDARFCTACGAVQDGAPAPEAAAEPVDQGPAQSQYGQPYAQPNYVQPGYAQPNYSQPNYAQTPPPYGAGYNAAPAAPKSNVMSTWAYVGSILLMAIPLAGFIIALVWAFGGTDNLNRRNLARATLIIMLIGIVLCVFLFVALGAMIATVIDQLGFSNYYGDYGWGYSNEFSEDFFEDYFKNYSMLEPAA